MKNGKRTFKLDIAVNNVLRVEMSGGSYQFGENASDEAGDEEFRLRFGKKVQIATGAVTEDKEGSLIHDVDRFKMCKGRVVYRLENVEFAF